MSCSPGGKVKTTPKELTHPQIQTLGGYRGVIG